MENGTSAQALIVTSFDELPAVLTVHHVRAWLHLSATEIYALCRAGEIPHRRIGRGKRGVLRFDKIAVKHWWDKESKEETWEQEQK